MSQLEKLKAAKDRKELATVLGYKPSALTAIIYHPPAKDRYTNFEIDKKSGGKRTIKAPDAKLKKLQSHLSHLLYACLDEIEKERDAKPLSFGFRRDRWIADNATRHKRRKWVLNLDLADYFPSFNFGRVRGFFLKDNSFALQPEVATTIAQIACDGTALPQGSPCSPIIAELIGQVLDMRLVRLAKKYGVTYSRYADDITFSTSQKDFPAGLASQDPTDATIWHLSDELLGKITASGFAVNPAKTRVQFRGSRQTVTGLVVNEKVNIPSEYYRNARAMCDALFSSGQYFTSMKASAPEPDLTSNLNPLEGVLGHIYAVTQTEDRRDVREQRIKPRAIRSLYRRFLFYKYFVALQAPLIVTEGKTDPVYLREAVKARTAFHPVLGAKTAGRFEHAVRYFNYGGLAHEILDLSGGGSGNLRSIPLDYRRNFQPSKNDPRAIAHTPLAHPVILVLDNDDGLASVASTIWDNFKVKIDVKTTAHFYHIIQNLYVVKTPEAGGKSAIESLFPDVWLNIELNGKKFNCSNTINPETEYSKEVFANSVVKPNAGNIDFSGFDLLLERIVAAIEHHRAK
ncbi:retron-type reverse transcriptase [Angulomicrobium tetraedrale]|uniref:RNA-directed DNA polymerase n=1 Tax=Ancylobacter tetraedralis TaxID=217068 RepID=A0A839ZF41_9HYPH|nr:retron Ec67 family RNA-directed DNA polymerase/endonuclease [Ancylobacter tetraedralis]MBB3773389.1 retron-type reverse transcriptase [Ancylobacter tetraedralis]